MRNLLAATALTMTMIGGNAIAANMSPLTYQAQPTDIRTSKLVGMVVYAAETEMAADTVVQPGAELEWNNIGEIDDVILSREGDVKAAIVGIGGFLGIGEKSVAIPMEDIKFVKSADDPDRYFLVVNSNKQMLTDAPAYGEVAETTPVVTDQSGTMQANGDQNNNLMPENNPDSNQAAVPATDPQADTTAMQDNADQNTTATPENSQVATNMATPNAPADHTLLVAPKVERNGYMPPEPSDLTAEKLTGAPVYGPKDEVVGEVNKLVLNDDGTVRSLVLDIGGFLGLGEHRIAVGLDEVSILRNQNGDDVRIYVDSSEGTLKALPEYTDG